LYVSSILKSFTLAAHAPPMRSDVTINAKIIFFISILSPLIFLDCERKVEFEPLQSSINVYEKSHI